MEKNESVGSDLRTRAEVKRNYYRKSAIITGVLFIACTASSILSGLFIGSLDAPDYLVSVAANESQVLTGMLAQNIWALTCVGIPVMLFPILKKHNESLSLGFFSLRLIEGVFVFLGIVCQLSLLTLSKEFVTGILDASYFQASGILLHAVRDWAFWVGPGIAFALSALVLNYTLYQSKFVPRWLSGLGLVGALVYIPVELLAFFGFDQFMVLAAPIALQEMALALWLIIKGFNSTKIAESATDEQS
ncbi:MAG: DUF4386 domain-containing protein [Candidatus Bathyarchaeota archaeon]|nr:DUF4386 domain-containing protein [Candidatus Bathyarchaeota archaeon]